MIKFTEKDVEENKKIIEHLIYYNDNVIHSEYLNIEYHKQLKLLNKGVRGDKC